MALTIWLCPHHARLRGSSGVRGLAPAVPGVTQGRLPNLNWVNTILLANLIDRVQAQVEKKLYLDRYRGDAGQPHIKIKDADFRATRCAA